MEQTEQVRRGRKRIRRKRSYWWMVPAGFSIFIWILFHTIFLMGYIPSESMEPTLKKGSYLIAVRKYASLETGDVIVFRWDGELLVKRIAVVGGDTVDLGSLPYTPGWIVPKRDKEIVTVPEGCFFVLGDNTENSLDSRYWEEMFVKEADVVAKVWE